MVSSLMFSLVLSLGTSIVLADTSQVDRNPFYSLSHIPHRFISNLCGFLHFLRGFLHSSFHSSCHSSCVYGPVVDMQQT